MKSSSRNVFHLQSLLDHNMQHKVAKICLLLTLTGLSTGEWVEIPQSKPTSNNPTASFSRAKVKQLAEQVVSNRYDDSSAHTTPSAEWIEYQRERFGLSNSNKLMVSAASVGSLKHSAQVVVPANVQTIHTRSKLTVKNASIPALVEVVVAPKVETTSRDLEHTTDEAEVIVETATERPPTAEPSHDELQLPTMQGFLKFLKTMQSRWIKKSAWSFEKKFQMLKQMRDNLMRVIEQQFSMLWQPTERKSRKRRGLLDESNLEFPPEAAIMSINFLTFAVFLIKLVMQVVHIVKSKHYTFSGFDINTEIVKEN